MHRSPSDAIEGKFAVPVPGFQKERPIPSAFVELRDPICQLIANVQQARGIVPKQHVKLLDRCLTDEVPDADRGLWGFAVERPV